MVISPTVHLGKILHFVFRELLLAQHILRFIRRLNRQNQTVSSMSHSLHHTIQKIACIKPILESNSYSFWFGVLLVLWRQQLSDLIPKVSVTKL